MAPHPEPISIFTGGGTGWSSWSDPYVVTGTAHILPGATLDAYTLRRQVRFLPLTDAWVTHRTDPSVDVGRPVLIVNTANLTELRPAMTVVGAPGQGS